MIRALIADDEPLARQRVRQLLKDEADVEIVAECASGVDALAAARELAPDLVFLDVQMPEMDGFALLAELPRERTPEVIFITAFDQHALRAFEERALDYLLKPFKPARFREAVQRARERLATKAMAAEPVPAPRAYLSRLTIKTSDKVLILKVGEIDSFESAGNYVSVNVGKQSHILRETLTALESQLDPEKFLRVSRAAIVNLDCVKELQPMFKGEQVVVLHNGRTFPTTLSLRDWDKALKFPSPPVTA